MAPFDRPDLSVDPGNPPAEQEIFACLERAGFDPAAYLDRNNDLRQRRYDATTATRHFIDYGHAEDRNPRFGPLGDGLADIAAAASIAPVRRRRLFRAAVEAQCSHPATEERLWALRDDAIPRLIIGMGGAPYFVVGDSHALNYVRSAGSQGRWLAGLPLILRAMSASSLSHSTGPSATGIRIMDWARQVRPVLNQHNIPIFLVFGGIDAEMRWIFQRFLQRINRFSLAQYDTYAREAVGAYAVFLDALTDVVGSARLRVCAAFPPSQPDAVLTPAYLAAFLVPKGDRSRLTEQFSQLEIPTLMWRTALRRLYNEHLRKACVVRGIAFVDSFTPLLNAEGVVDQRYFAARDSEDIHLDHEAIGPVVAANVWRALGQDAGALTKNRGR